jgi:hypothetical protein
MAKYETKQHRKIYEQHHGIKIPTNMEIHHIDGKHSNNDINNLKLVTWQEHYDIHYSQGDWAACLLISGRHSIAPEERSRLASMAATKANKEGKCGFKLGHASAAGKIGGQKGGKSAKENKTGIFSLNTEQHKQRHLNSVISKLIKSGKMCAWPQPNPTLGPLS